MILWCKLLSVKTPQMCILVWAYVYKKTGWGQGDYLNIICFTLSPDIDQALYLFNELREQDPFRIENMDTFSNLLYVRVRAAGAFWMHVLHLTVHVSFMSLKCLIDAVTLSDLSVKISFFSDAVWTSPVV